MKKALMKDSFKEIKNTHRRFLSILLMAFLGVGFFAGIRATSPDMVDTIDKYYKEQNVYDIQVISTLGLTNDDIDAISKIEGVEKAIGEYEIDGEVEIDNKEIVTKVIGIDEINKQKLLEGRLPENIKECVVESNFLSLNNKKIGDDLMKKFLTFIIILVLLALVVFLGFKLLDKGESNENEIIDNTVNEEKNNTSNNKSDSNTTSQSEENQEYNTTIYIGTEDNFEEFTVNIDKSGSATYQASQILEAIGDILGYRLIANDITDGKGGMTIDFNSNSAPFNTNDSYIGNEQYTTNDDLAFTIFDSIEKTLQEYFGQNLDVWFSLDSGSITINDVTIPITEPYQGSNYYLK